MYGYTLVFYVVLFLGSLMSTDVGECLSLHYGIHEYDTSDVDPGIIF